ncbi:hypothetical protein ACHHYP_10359 [Achlya hypogyna]|uniref:Transmembrane protein n=1 Tax=Achlya hypogyna TaxID=1202772 RepID=A0A1V9YLL2_ACHHY|nr:hypothetical protein ACHHYP_10359 [Achlya hypogyna]
MAKAPPPSSVLGRLRHRYPRAETLLGFTYIWGSLASGIVYLSIINPSFSNDLWWGHYNLSGYQAFLIDISNAAVATRGKGVFDTLAPVAAMRKDYGASVSYTTVYPTYARGLILSELTSVEYAVTNLRTLSASWSMRMNTQCCWVDFAHQFQLAHTVKRQARCSSQYAGNGAVHLEAILRNQVWSKWMTTWGNYFSVAVQLGLEETAGGRQWLTTTATALNTTTAAQESAYWTANGITYFQLQWLNRWSTGISETMTIENALGWKQQYTIKNVPRIIGPWTTLVYFWLPYNDLWVIDVLNRSWIRGTSNYFGANVSATAPPVNLMDWAAFAAPTGACTLLTTRLGELTTIDMWYIPPPPALVALVGTFNSLYYEALLANDALASTVNKWTLPTLQPTPPSWLGNGMVYFGGNPTCYTNAGTSYVQRSFDFYDACVGTSPLEIALTAPSLLFALFAQSPKPVAAASTCSLQAFAECAPALSQGADIIASYLSPAPATISTDVVAATKEVQSTGAMLMQFAARNGVFELLTQPILADDAWNLYGWAMVFQWVTGEREVVSFQGDYGTWPLISNAYAGSVLSTSGGGEKLSNATQSIFYLMAYTSFLLVVVGILCSIFGLLIHFQVIGANLFLYNRVVGSVWIGRPMLVVRGLTAIGILSTSQVTLMTTGGFTHFTFAPRLWLATLVVAGEATWVTYVVNDVLLLFASKLTPVYAPYSCYLVWLAYFVVEIASPVQISATLNRQCHSVDMDYALNCDSGTVRIGSSDRVVLLLVIQVVALIFTFVVSFALHRRRKYITTEQAPLLISGTSDSFMSRLDGQGVWNLDKVSSIMCGLVPIRLPHGRSATFDLKLWLVIPDDTPHDATKTFNCPSLGLTEAKAADRLTSSKRLASEKRKIRLTRLSALFGLGFIMASVAGSVSYIIVSQVNLANDLSWATFNITGAHAFIASYFNEQLTLGANAASIRLDSANVVQVAHFNLPTASVASPNNLGALMQYTQLNVIGQTIEAFRSMDACAMPWVFSQYCYVDFQRRWSVANSAQRQARCTAMIGNGAVYLESFLRNIEWTDLSECWGSSFAIAIGDELQTTQAGRAWLAQIQGPMVSVADEVAHWTASGITEYTTQWQNYKKIGLINSYAIENALGVAYDFTLQYLNGSFQFAQQSTFKMYWALGSDWELVARNSSAIGGMSLVRGSNNFAFANQTLESVMVTNGTLSLPFNNIFASVRTFLGPFGSVDMFYVAPTEEALRGFRTVQAAIRSALAGSLKAQQDFFLIEPIDAVRPVPKAWLALNTNSFGGSLLCYQPGSSGDQRLLAGLINLASYSIACSTNGIYSQVQPNREYIVLSALLSGVATSPRASVNLPDICNQDTGHLDHCVSYLKQSFAFVDAHITDVSSLATTSLAVTHAIQALNIEFVQFVGANATAPMTVLHKNVLDPADPTFLFFGWWYLCDWVFGTREVISFQGDGARINVLSEYLAPYSEDVRPWQFPTTLANYARSAIMYVTVVMISVSVLVFVYILVSRGYVEGFNMMELNRVGAIVWIGRPLLFIRSMTAIMLLSTGTLELTYSGFVSTFVVPSNPWYKTLLAASEVTWLVSVVNDVTMIITQEYTSYFITPNSMTVWVICAVLSQLQPVIHETTIKKVCHVVQVDYQIVCTSATVVIGQQARFLALIYIVLACNVLSFLFVRVLLPLKPVQPNTSLFLAAGAKFLFLESKWTFDDVYYLDRASAVLNGILSWRTKTHIYAFDIKVWRVLAIRLPSHMLDIDTDVEPSKFAIPLTD